MEIALNTLSQAVGFGAMDIEWTLLVNLRALDYLNLGLPMFTSNWVVFPQPLTQHLLVTSDFFWCARFRWPLSGHCSVFYTIG